MPSLAQRKKEGGTAPKGKAAPKGSQAKGSAPTPRTLGLIVAGVAILTVAVATQYILRGQDSPTSETRPAQPQVASPEVREDDLVEPAGLDVLGHLSAQHNESLLWGTYRPQFLFGVKSRTFPDAVVAGIMWGSVKKGDQLDTSKLRHTCEEEDVKQGLKFGFAEHDGTAYGRQPISDPANKMSFQTYFYKRDARTWAMRISGNSTKGKKALFFYLGVDQEYVVEKDSSLASIAVEQQGAVGEPTVLKGSTPSLGTFRLLVLPRSGSLQPMAGHEVVPWTAPPGTPVASVKAALLAQLKQEPDAGDVHRLLESPVGGAGKASTLVALQLVVEQDFEVDFVLDGAAGSGGLGDALAVAKSVSGAGLTEKLGESSAQFHARFEQTFGLKARGAPEEEVTFAQAAMSTMMGSLGYFYGSYKVKLSGSPGAPDRFRQSAPLPLFANVPSRSFFPRGFLWDEGFHQLLVGRWSPAISRDVIAHWLNSMRANGWIPREQILGAEALTKVPEQFVAQNPQHANPPTLLLAIEALLEAARGKDGAVDADTAQWLSAIFPALERWFQWFINSQRGVVPKSFRWHGRDPGDGKLNAMTLTSGLDDWPRASVVSDEERHVDLHCWVAFGAGVLARVGEQAGLSEAKVQEYRNMGDELVTSLEEMHWDDTRKRFNDFGMHSNDGRYVPHVVVKCGTNDGADSIEHGIAIDVFKDLQQGKTQKPPCPASHPKFMFPLGDGQGGLLQREKLVPKTEKPQFVDHSGYVNLFPLLLRLLPPDSPRLPDVLELLGNPKKGIWSNFGLRSLAKGDKMYLRDNAPGDVGYWRGPIWINCNFLAVRALKHYAALPGPSQEKAAELLEALSRNLVQNLLKNFQQTGYLWEQYNPKDGKGQRTHPFNGWSSLVVLIMA